MSRAWLALRLAASFLTVAPIPIRPEAVTDRAIADSRLAYPFVGTLIGLGLAGVAWACSGLRLGPGPSAALILAAWAGLSGGLHLDGLADTADGLFLWGDPARRLAAMKDPHVGSFGVATLVIVLLAKFAALESLTGPGRCWALVGSAIVGRALVLVAAGIAPYARPEGTGRVLVDATTRRDAGLGLAFCLGVGAGIGGPRGLAGAAVAVGIAVLLASIGRRKLGGVTGDVLGAAVEVGEVTVLLALAPPQV